MYHREKSRSAPHAEKSRWSTSTSRSVSGRQDNGTGRAMAGGRAKARPASVPTAGMRKKCNPVSPVRKYHAPNAGIR